MSEMRILEEKLEDYKHTPGPWEIDGHFNSEDGVRIVRRHEDEALDGFPICGIQPIEFEWAPDEIANAHLIAAAPELLEALKTAAACVEWCRITHLHGPQSKEGIPIELIWKELIAKAEGRTTPPGRAEQSPTKPEDPTEAKQS